MPTQVDDYIQEVIKKGDEGSALLARVCAPTLKNCEYVDVLRQGMNGMSVLRLPKGYFAVVHSAGGCPEFKDVRKHAASMVVKLSDQARKIGAQPLAFANVIDSRKGDSSMLEDIANAMVEQADRFKLAIMNGENAILGSRVNCDANVSGTMISMIKPKDSWAANIPGYGLFNPRDLPISINSDGIGTKTEFYERAARFDSCVYELGIFDWMAMDLDDTSKSGATARVISGVCETRGDIPIDRIRSRLKREAERMDIIGILEHEPVGSRLRGYEIGGASYNISGSVVSTIDEKMLKNPPRPHSGESVVAIRGEPNPRSNGITDKRKTMIKLFGEHYENTREGKLFLEYLASPSTVLYPVFKELIEKGIAKSVYHMSGGAYNGKLARPLAKHGLYARLKNLFQPDWRELALAGAAFASAKTAYAKWPMGNDGFITTRNPEKAMEAIRRFRLEARVVGKVVKTASGITGVTLEAFNGESVCFYGKD